MAFVVNSVLANGVDFVLEKEFASFALQEPCYNQNFSDTYYPHNSPSFICCAICGGPHESFQSMQSMVEMSRQREQVANLSTHTFEPSRRFNSIYYDDDDNDDDEERTIPLRDIISQLPLSIVITTSLLILLIMDPEVSLIMRNEDLSTIYENESDEFIKSSVEDFVPIPMSSKIHPGVIVSAFYLHFTSSDEESLSDEDVPKDNVKIYSNPLFEFDDDYISSDVNPLFDEVLEDVEYKDSYASNLDESTFLVTPLSDSNEDEYFAPCDDVELLLHRDPSTPTMSVVSILEGFTDESPLEENDDLFDLESKKNDWKKILYDARINDLMTEDKVFDPEILKKFFSLTYMSLPFKDCQYLFFTYVIQILLIYFTYPVDSPFLITSKSEDTIFDLGIFAFYFLEPVASHQSGTFICFYVYLNILNESPMDICSSTRFNPNITMIWGESS
nr:hypothetical protein [Tanacetum cinerariifolium]